MISSLIGKEAEVASVNKIERPSLHCAAQLRYEAARYAADNTECTVRDRLLRKVKTQRKKL